MHTERLAQCQSGAEAEPVDEVVSRPLTDEDKYYLEQYYKGPVESVRKIEDTAKFLFTATATVSGIFAAATKLVHGANPPGNLWWVVPFICWVFSIVAFLAVLHPDKYSVGRNVPDACRAAFVEARDTKYKCLCAGTVLFILGLGMAVVTLAA